MSSVVEAFQEYLKGRLLAVGLDILGLPVPVSRSLPFSVKHKML